MRESLCIFANLRVDFYTSTPFSLCEKFTLSAILSQNMPYKSANTQYLLYTCQKLINLLHQTTNFEVPVVIFTLNVKYFLSVMKNSAFRRSRNSTTSAKGYHDNICTYIVVLFVLNCRNLYSFYDEIEY